MSHESKVIKNLYRKIPTFKCKPGCHGCCGPIPFSQWEWNRIKDKREHRSLLHCPYESEQGCDIYETRPYMCRLFGTVNDPKLICPHGCGPAVKLTAQQADKMTREYISVMQNE